MNGVRGKWYIYLVLSILAITYVVFIFNRNTDIETKLDEVKLKTEINEISKNSFAIMVEKEDGSGYEEVDEFPLDYMFNEELSGCIDIDGKTLENALSYSDGVVTVNVNSTAYCYLYFDYNPIPKEFTFYVGGNSNPEYVTSTNTTVYLSWEDTNITHYCVTNTQGSDNCTWNEVSGNSIDASHTLTSGDGTKTVYAYLKNNAGNISPEVNDSIYLDSSAPTGNSVSINSGASTTNSTSVTLTLASTGASQMCISNTSSCSSWVTYATSKSHTLTTGDGTKTVYVWFRDEYGNTTNYVTDTITLSTATYVCTTNTALGSCLKSAKTAGFNSTMEGGLYRYQGASGSVNNYVCFGTTDKATCINNADKYMYRIMGLNSNNQLKLVKRYPLNPAQWYTSYAYSYSNVSWPNSILYTNINGSSFLTNTTYIPSSWSSKIATTSWKYGDNVDNNKTAGELYNIENTWTDTVDAKIGLMYLHDYYYAYKSGGINCVETFYYCRDSWLSLDNEFDTPTETEWTMSRYGADDRNFYNAWGLKFSGSVDYHALTTNSWSRPVFFLTSSVKYISGSGTASDPFIIS